MKIKDLVVDEPRPHDRILIEFSTTLCSVLERQDMKNTFIVRGIRLLGNQKWEVYTTNECFRRRGCPPTHLATIHEPLTDNPGWQFHIPFGQNGIMEAFQMFARVKQIFEDMANGYGSVSG